MAFGETPRAVTSAYLIIHRNYLVSPEIVYLEFEQMKLHFAAFYLVQFLRHCSTVISYHCTLDNSGGL